MKKYILSILIIFSQIGYLTAQKEDYIWMVGSINPQLSNTRMSSVNFHTQPPTVTNYTNTLVYFLRNATCISDSVGNFLFASTGVFAVNKNLDTMQNGAGLNLNGFNDQDLQPQASIILPSVNNSHEYYLIYHLLSAINGIPYKLLYAKIDMSLNNGLGAVVQKNIPIITDNLAWESLQAVRHANGRDWWLLCPKHNSNLIYRILYSPLGFQNMGTQAAGYSTAGINICAYSPDGNKFIQYLINERKIRIHDFDRCTGTLKSYFDLVETAAAEVGPQGISVSPNLRYLYVNNCDTLFQYDLQSANIQDSKQLIAISDSIHQCFWMHRLAPDGKIYLSSGSNYLHVINSPDSAGTACNFVQRQVFLLSNVDGLPNLPNYRLGREVGSACDTVYTNIKEEGIRKEVSIYPNPATDKLYISIAGIKEPLTILLLNTLGQEVASYALAQKEQEISLTNLPKGVYYCRVLGREGAYFATKVVKE
jgi:hypothetical protein